MSYYLSMLVLFLAVISLTITNGRNYSPPTGIPHIHSKKTPMIKPPVPISVPGVPHIHPPRPSRPPP